MTPAEINMKNDQFLRILSKLENKQDRLQSQIEPRFKSIAEGSSGANPSPNLLDASSNTFERQIKIERAYDHFLKTYARL